MSHAGHASAQLEQGEQQQLPRQQLLCPAELEKKQGSHDPSHESPGD